MEERDNLQILGMGCSERGIPACSHGEVKGRHHNKAPLKLNTPHIHLTAKCHVLSLFPPLAFPLLRQSSAVPSHTLRLGKLEDRWCLMPTDLQEKSLRHLKGRLGE